MEPASFRSAIGGNGGKEQWHHVASRLEEHQRRSTLVANFEHRHASSSAGIADRHEGCLRLDYPGGR